MTPDKIRAEMQTGIEFSNIEKFSDTAGKNRIALLSDEIANLLYQKIHPNSGKHIEVQGHVRPFVLYDDTTKELALIGGQISQFFYTKTKDEGGLLPILGDNFDEQTNNLWECMDPEKGYVAAHFVYWEGPQRNTEIFTGGHRSIYDGDTMFAYRISLRLQRKSTRDKTVILSFLKIKKEDWNRTREENLFI